TNLANKFLRANGITLFKVKDEMDKLLGEADRFALTGVHPQITDDAQRALDWAKSRKLFAKPRPCGLML
ncbi:ATP-dependent Clp protease ATP-binding subunit clpA-like protein, partial [Trifolium medium]|nr:ATP-dependent Clp protease ATP-binding subunit clpA-like protein [Trifolium medium]